jgi:hypothetical protein
MSYNQPTAPPAGPPGNYYPPQPPQQQPQGTSGLAIAGLVLAFLAAPLGFILSLVAVFKTGRGKRKGRGMAIAGLIVSVLIIGSTTALVVAASNSTLADPGCTAGKDAILSGASSSDANSIQTTIDGLNAAAAKAKHDNVRNAMKALADDYSKMLAGVKAGNIPDGLTEKISDDATTIDSLCTFGS